MTMVDIIEPRTARLLLRRWRDTDLEPFSALNRDGRVMEFFPATLSRTESDALAKRLELAIESRGWGLWAVEELQTGEFIGFVGLQDIAAQLPCAPGVEVGWRLAHAAWGKGYATEAARAALDVGFRALGLHEILSLTAVRNVRSRAVMSRLGMSEDPETFDHPALPVDSPLRRHCLHRLSRSDWLTRSDRDL